jgi:hypothetical protein
MGTTREELVREYVAAAGDGRIDALTGLVHPDATFGGTVKTETQGAEAFVQGFRNLAPIVRRNEVRMLIVEDDHAAVLYDFVTDTPVGSVLCAEFLTFEDDLIRSSVLLFDWRRWPEVLAELGVRTTERA